MTRVVLFVAGLAGIFLTAFTLGRALEIEERTTADAHAAGAGSAMAPSAAASPGGLSLEQDGYRIVAERQALLAGRAVPYVFRVLDPGGEVLREYDVEQEKRLHLIVVSRALDRFVHLHPQQRADGAWTVSLTPPEQGSYRVFADFTTRGERRTLGIDLQVSGRTRSAADPFSQYDISLDRTGDKLDFVVRDGGDPVELLPYLGARGHLVVLREGDLAYIHAHADEERLSFDVPFPSEGRYRLFLQFRVGDTVETASLTVTR